MPSHPDRVRRNYEPLTTLYFRDIPIHVCSKADPTIPFTMLDQRSVSAGICPFCFENIKLPDSAK